MIQTTETPPHPALASYVRCYTYREFNTNGQHMVKPWYSIQQISMPFFFGALPVRLSDPISGTTLKTGKPTGIVGLGRQFNGNMEFCGHYTFFEILFRPNGFRSIFNIPSRQIIDQIVWGEELFQQDQAELHEQMYYAANIGEMTTLANSWLLHHLSRQRVKTLNERITHCANTIVKGRGLISLDQLSRDVNMSPRTFERNFQSEIGLSPKHLCCITRFNYALEMKLNKPQLDWTSIAQYAGYFDQMHLIKDFRRFAGSAPKSLLRHAPMFEVEYTGAVQD